MVLYSGQGDDGKTQFFGCDQRWSKSSAIAEALGVLDEINSLLGVCRAQAAPDRMKILIGGKLRLFAEVISDVQNDLFTIQAEIAGADKKISADQVKKLEKIIAVAEKGLPPITSFIVSGGTELSALLDYARAVARRAERRVMVACPTISPKTFAYLNRLSSLLYVLARFVNAQAGVKEDHPRY